MNVGEKVAKLDRSWTDPTFKARYDQGSYTSLNEAEQEAKSVADDDNWDAVIVKEGEEFRVFAIGEVRKEFGGLWSDNTLYGAAEGVYEFVITDPGDGSERIAGTSDSSATVDRVSRWLKKDHYVPYDLEMTWLLARKLDAEAWGVFMEDFASKGEYGQQKIAAGFGDPSISDYRQRAADGMQKLLAVSIQKGLEARFNGKLKDIERISGSLQYAAKLPGLPQPAKDFIGFYTEALTKVPRDVAKMLINPNKAPNTALWHFYDVYSATTGDTDFENVMNLFDHIKQVYR